MTEVLAGAVGVFLLVVVVWSGLNGTEAPDRNFSLTFVFVTFWLGLVVLSVVFGDLFRAFNPWRAIARVVGGGFRLVAGQSAPPPLGYPERLGRWPAAAGILAFVWLELVYGPAGFQTVGLTPHTVAIATLVYSAYTFVGMTLFGSERWLERGEAFSVYFGMFASLAPLEVRDGTLGRRRPLVGVRPDGSRRRAPWRWCCSRSAPRPSTARPRAPSRSRSPPCSTGWSTRGSARWPRCGSPTRSSSALTLGFVAGLFWAGIYGMHTVRTSVSTRKLGTLFAHAFIPIALAYLVAHYFSLVVFQEQAQFTFLLSDPLGDGSDYFGTADSGIDYGTISANAIWYVQVGALIVGHVTALVLGHDRALKVYGDTRVAARSQYWMLALMVGFTSLGLYLLSQANQ